MGLQLSGSDTWLNPHWVQNTLQQNIKNKYIKILGLKKYDPSGLYIALFV